MKLDVSIEDCVARRFAQGTHAAASSIVKLHAARRPGEHHRRQTRTDGLELRLWLLTKQCSANRNICKQINRGYDEPSAARWQKSRERANTGGIDGRGVAKSYAT